VDIRSIKILLLEDEDILAKLYLKKLTEVGFEVRLYEEVKKLLEEVVHYKPDMAFLDHALQGVNKSGLDVIPVLKKVNPAMAIIMLSNYSEFQMKEESRKAGAIDYLLKINTSPATLANYAQRLSTQFL